MPVADPQSSRSTSPGSALLSLLACIALMSGVAIIGSWVTTPQIPGWYATLAKPAWTPPNSVFPIAWTLLYCLMAVSLWRLWNAARGAARRRAITLFLIQLALNAVWSPVFFAAHAIVAALVVIVMLAVAIALTIRAAFAVDRLAGWLLVPYMAWICYALSLNLAIALNN